MRVVGYVRVSTDEQAAGGVSLDAQEAKVRAYCGLYGLDLVELVSDPGESGKSLSRPGLARALARLRDGSADGLVVAKLDRLTRSVADLAVLLGDYFDERAGKQLFSVADSIDTRTAAGRLVLNVLMSVAQWERETIVERTRDALAHKRARGERTGSVPYGWDLDGPARLVKNPAEQKGLALIRDLRDRGASHRGIAATLNSLEIPTKSGRGPWRHATVAKILLRKPTPEAPDADQETAAP